ncbi:MAG: tRNA (cytosine(32)/uridine(32)-2'-O)-methyltransferase TrmJ, partial [Candidatus Methylophosphatis roskildensis]
PHEDVDRLVEHFERAMIESGFLDPASPRRLIPRLRRLFARARIEREEVAILRGMLSAFEQPPGKPD